MGLTVGILRETAPRERRVAITPRAVELLTKMGADVWVERGAGQQAGFPDADYEACGVHWGANADEVRQLAQILLCVRVPEPRGLSSQHTVIGFCDPLSEPHRAAAMAETGANLFAVELVPRITRAQSMDALSSMASIAGYKAVILAADAMPRMFPMMMTAAGTIPPAKVLVIGAGVAGLQAIATARRLGAVVMGYDVRTAVKEQIESLGAKFLTITLDGSGEGEGGYAKQLTEAQIQSQRQQMAAALREQDLVITTAAVPGRTAPILITREMMRGMIPGAVIVDIAAERGGNCEVTRAGETVAVDGVSVIGPVNLPATVPYHASQMYARNLCTFLKNMVKDGALRIDLTDEIVRETLVAQGGKVVHPKVQALLGSVVNA
ncbi:MAG TPA: Re/Si-specific NAD(P)(+) transhydrogenase subunit alpha [Bryobacteraceae bacterium]|nr:Re/Si-specific NAD(P)(+) transhydrogenase subunit alpha [Bryobacteraceae bacterium]